MRKPGRKEFSDATGWVSVEIPSVPFRGRMIRLASYTGVGLTPAQCRRLAAWLVRAAEFLEGRKP